MKNIIKELCRGILVCCIIPALMIGFVVAAGGLGADGVQTQPTVPTLPQLNVTAPLTPEHTETSPPISEPIMISVIVDGQRQEMPLEAYILCVVLGEMPADFETEALKAQAVVARTYTAKIVEGSRHNGGVCTKSSCCQAYCDAQEYLGKGGTEEKLQKVRSAVEATAGQVLTYEGQLITATYFSCSGGSTEDAAAVWGYDVPYLQSVKSPGEEASAAYSREKTFTPEEFRKKMAVRLKGKPETWFGKVTYTEGGGVETICIGGVSYRGTTIRSLLGLRSTMFTVQVEDGQIVFRTKGYGHRVGMSQYGADAMALAGSSYEQILAHYYTGTVLTNIH